MAIVYLPPQERSLLERIAYALLAFAVIVLGFFFLAAAVVAGAILAGVVLLRFWWFKRKLRKAADQEFLSTEYRVVDREQSTASREPPRQ
jgi:hypothetical protein